MDNGEVDGDKPICPRCGSFIPNDEQPGAYPGALSRTDNFTEVCSACGSREAMEQFAGLHNLVGEARDWWDYQRAKAWHAGQLRN